MQDRLAKIRDQVGQSPIQNVSQNQILGSSANYSN